MYIYIYIYKIYVKCNFNEIYIQCIGEEMINGLLCEKWRLVQEIEEKTNKYTLWIRYKVYTN